MVVLTVASPVWSQWAAHSGCLGSCPRGDGGRRGRGRRRRVGEGCAAGSQSSLSLCNRPYRSTPFTTAGERTRLRVHVRGAWAAAAEENGSGQTVGPGGLAVRPMPRGSLPLPATSSRQGHGGQVCVLHCPVPRLPSVGVGRGTGRPGQGPAPPLRLLPAGRRAEQRREACGLEWVSLPRRPAGLATPPTWSCGLLGLPQGGPVPLGSARHGHSALPG